jgi:hypothetical protein
VSLPRQATVSGGLRRSVPDAPDQLPKSVFVERRRVDDYQSKPAAIRRQWIERLYVRGRFLELFGTEPVAGWSVFGSDQRQWGARRRGRPQTRDSRGRAITAP